MTAASAPALELEAGADALRDTLAAIRCARGGDRAGLEAIAAGTTVPRRALATLAIVGTVMAARGANISHPPASGWPASLISDVLAVMSALRAGDSGKAFHIAINTVGDPRSCFRMGAVMLATAAVQAGLSPSETDAIGRDFTDHLIDLTTGLTGRDGG